MINKLRASFAAMILVTVAALVALTGCGDKSSSSSSAARAITTAAEELTEAQTEASSAEVTTALTTKKAKTTSAVTTAAKTTTAKVTTTKTKKTTTAKTTTTKVSTTQPATAAYVNYTFRSNKYLTEHFEKHGSEFDGDFNYRTAKEYEKGASDVINNPDALFKYEAEDGDGVYYLEATNEFVILSKDGYIRTYFRPSKGKSYFDRQ